MLRRWDLLCQLNPMNLDGYKPENSSGALAARFESANMVSKACLYPSTSWRYVLAGDQEFLFVDAKFEWKRPRKSRGQFMDDFILASFKNPHRQYLANSGPILTIPRFRAY